MSFGDFHFTLHLPRQLLHEQHPQQQQQWLLLNKFANLLEELCARVVAIEEKINQHETDHLAGGANNPINDYPEIQHHQHGSQHYGGSPGLTV